MDFFGHYKGKTSAEPRKEGNRRGLVSFRLAAALINRPPRAVDDVQILFLLF